MEGSKHSYRLSKNDNIKKTNVMNKATLIIIISSLTANLGFLALPSMADREYFYKNCAELQKAMNDYNPGDKYEGFEKVRMMRKKTGFEQYIVFCNGGIVKDGTEKTICRGYIAYAFARVPATARYFTSWGTMREESNLYDADQGKYCRRVK